MAQQPLGPKGGRSPQIRARVPQNELDEFEQAANRLGITRSQFVRLCLRYGISHPDAVMPSERTEVAAIAS